MDHIISCELCGSVGRLLRCSRCKTAYYCSKKHQELDWKKHRLQCDDRSKPKLKKESTTSTAPKSSTVYSSASTTEEFSIDSESVLPSLPENEKCVKNTEGNTSPFPSEGSSESVIISACTEILSPNLDLFHPEVNSPTTSESSVSVSVSTNNPPLSNYGDDNLQSYILHERHPNELNEFSEICLDNTDSIPPFLHRNDREQDIMDTCTNVIRDMDTFGVCVLDNFLGMERGKAVLNEVIGMYETGVFEDGQLVSNKVKTDRKTIRGDQITWIDGKESSCRNIGMLISKVDAIITRANRMANNGKMGDYTINGRTKVSFLKYQ